MRRRAKPKAKKRARRHEVVVQRVVVRRRPKEAREVIGMRCRVVEQIPEAEVLVLTEPVTGQKFVLPLVSRERDGRLAMAFQPLVNRDVWLSIRIG